MDLILFDDNGVTHLTVSSAPNSNAPVIDDRMDIDSSDVLFFSPADSQRLDDALCDKFNIFEESSGDVKRKRRFYEHLNIEDKTKLFARIFELLESSSPQAEARRRTSRLTVVGTSVPAIREDLRVSLKPIMDKLSNINIKVDENCIRHLFLPPHKGHKSAARYWGVIEARVAQGENSLHDQHPLVRLYFIFLFFRHLFCYLLLLI
jgi:hypothetical protein